MTFKKLALVAALLITSITAAAAAPGTDTQADRSINVGENGGGGAGS
jgi:hypothetical protein